MKHIKLFESWLNEAASLTWEEEFDKIWEFIYEIYDAMSQLQSFGVADSEGEVYLRYRILQALSDHKFKYTLSQSYSFCPYRDDDGDSSVTVKYTDMAGNSKSTIIESGEEANDFLEDLCKDLDRLAKTLAEVTVETVTTSRMIEQFIDNIMDFDGELEREEENIREFYSRTSIALNWKIHNNPEYHGARSGKKFNL
jgi:hypothetical protein